MLLLLATIAVLYLAKVGAGFDGNPPRNLKR
jgi:hypothetical protein